MAPNDQIDTAERLVRVETKLDFLINHYIQKHEDIESRIKALERWVNMAMGGLIILNTALGIYTVKLQGLL